MKASRNAPSSWYLSLSHLSFLHGEISAHPRYLVGCEGTHLEGQATSQGAVRFVTRAAVADERRQFWHGRGSYGGDGAPLGDSGVLGVRRKARPPPKATIWPWSLMSAAEYHDQLEFVGIRLLRSFITPSL